MSFPLNQPANTSKTGKIVYDGQKALLNEQVKKGMGLNDILCVIDELFNATFKGQSIECINLEDLGIKCLDPNKSKQCAIFEYLLQGIKETNTTLNTLQTAYQVVKSSIGAFADEKVKVNSAGKAGYLSDLLSANAPNTIKYNNDQVIFYGLVPVGFRGTVSRNRLSDFDSTGKGKAGTDLWGWAIPNGNNGLPNILGLFSMYASDIALGDTTGGSNTATLSIGNIGSFALAVSGTITESLQNDIKLKVNLGSRNKCFGIGGCRDVLVPEDGADKIAETNALNLKHTHGFSLSATHTNPNPTPIDIVPRHIKEIPIERIIV